MKRWFSIALSGAIFGLMGCSSPRKVAVLDPIEPAPADSPATTGDGSLQVYSARRPAGIELTKQEWLWNNDFGRNDFLFSPAHTDYAVYDDQGVLLRRVRNVRDANDSEPAIVPLPPGRYEIQADAENGYGGSIAVQVPVVIRAGQNTKVQLIGFF